MSFRIEKIDRESIHEIAYEFPESGGRQAGGVRVATGRLSVFRAFASGMPASLQALVVTSDLQGREPSWARPGKERRLLGEVVVEELSVLCDLGELPPRESVGVILAGDLFVAASLDKRGGKGDVRRIWQLCHRGFRWVSGVAGNHDRFGCDDTCMDEWHSSEGIYYLDGGTVQVDGLRLGGVSGIIGNPAKPFRREECDFLDAIAEVTEQKPDILVLHQGPSGRRSGRPGHAAVRELLERCEPMLVVCGHNHWEEPDVEELPNGVQVLNTDARAYVIQPSEHDAALEPACCTAS